MTIAVDCDVKNQNKPNRMSVLIWIQNVWDPDDFPKKVKKVNFEKSADSNKSDFKA